MTQSISTEDLTSILDRSYDGLEEQLRICTDKFNAAIHHVNEWRNVLYLKMDVIHRFLEMVREALRKLEALAQTAWRHHMPVASLLVQSFNWIRDVHNPVVGFHHPKSNLAHEWEGKAADAYWEKVTAQNEATKAVAHKADEVSKFLMDIATANVTYMTTLVKMATKFAAKFVEVACETVGVLTIPDAIKQLAAGIGALTEEYLGLMAEGAKRIVETCAKLRTLMTLMADTSLPGGQWPQAVTG
ncbi:hypothetical protein ACIA8G_11815 [Lentzea sp. NPDC051213]|uniref:hypothetical protein n=1 Tax=Lentzea sp. NPDC051213 TaxID=3364126 RepID=UPI0037B06111